MRISSGSPGPWRHCTRFQGASPVRAVVTDFDGVHTDDTAIIDADGGERVRVSREDGMGWPCCAAPVCPC